MSLVCQVLTANSQSLDQKQEPSIERQAYQSLPQYDSIINLRQRGADPLGKTPIDSVLGEALNEISEEGTVLFFPAGTFLLNSGINLPSNAVLRGVSSDSTELIFDLKGRGHSISVKGKAASQEFELDQNLELGQSVMELSGVNLDHSTYAMIVQNDSNWITSSWAKNTLGQIIRVDEMIGYQCKIKTPLRHQYFKNLNPRILIPDFVSGTGIENMRITRKDPTSNQTSNVLFQYATNCWVYGVHFDHCNFGHVTFERSADNLVTGCYFENGFNYGGGGKAYGVVLQHTSSDNVIENNIFRKLRHSILLQSGANGNAVSYNYSYEPHWDGGFFPDSYAGDLVLHGNYVYGNLFEGNVVQNIVIDNSHGINGPRNTFIRNRAEHAGIFMNSSQVSDSQHFIGNEITGTGQEVHNGFPFPRGLYSLAGKGHYEYGNNHNGTMIPFDIQSLHNSYYLSEAPEFWTSPSPWPAIGYPNDLGSGFIPAQIRKEQSKYTVSRQISSREVQVLLAKAIQKGSQGIEIQFELSGLLKSDKIQIYKLDSEINRYEFFANATFSAGANSKIQPAFDAKPYQGVNQYRVWVQDSSSNLIARSEFSTEFKVLSGISVAKNSGEDGYFISGLNNRLPTVLMLVDMQGRQVSVRELDPVSQLSYDLNSVPKGLYLLNVRNGNTQFSTKLRHL